MTVEASELVPGAVFRATKRLRTYCCEGEVPAGAKVTVWHKQGRISKNRIIVHAEPGGTHKVRKSSLRMAAEPWGLTDQQEALLQEFGDRFTGSRKEPGE